MHIDSEEGCINRVDKQTVSDNEEEKGVLKPSHSKNFSVGSNFMLNKVGYTKHTSQGSISRDSYRTQLL